MAGDARDQMCSLFVRVQADDEGSGSNGSARDGISICCRMGGSVCVVVAKRVVIIVLEFHFECCGSH